MRILFDQGTPAPLRGFLPGHVVVTAYEQGWSTLKNGDLIAAAEAEGFEISSTFMSREYKISCTPLRGAALSAILRQLPSPIKRPQLQEIYNYRVDSDGYYLVDRLIDRPVAASALLIFLDAALTTERSIKVAVP